MKASEIITLLQEAIEEYGDLELRPYDRNGDKIPEPAIDTTYIVRGNRDWHELQFIHQ